MNLTYTRPGELRKPDVEVLPDGRIRITRYIAAGHGDRDLSEVTESVGTADKGVATALLVKRGMAQVAGKDAIVKTYEVMNPSSETQVGLPDVQYTESGQKTMVYDFIQMSSGTYVPGTIGTTAAPGDANCILRTEQVEDDGTTRQIRRVFINKGLLQQTDETKNNGALLLKTFVYLNDAPIPNPPTGYTLVSQQTQNPNGLETTTYVYAKGDGEIARDVEYSDSGNQGTTGVTRTTIRYLVAPGGAVQPASLAGSVAVGQSFQDSDGHRIWTTNWAKGIGQISQEDSISNNGALLRRTIRHLAAPASSNPIVTPALYTLVNQAYQDSDGYRVWVASYASGSGQISQEDSTSNNGALLRRTIRHLAPPASSNPITTPAGYTLIEEAYQDADGHRVWTSSYAQGDGKISQQDTTSNNGALLRRSIRYLTGPSGSNPIVTPVGYTLIDESYQEADGHRIWSASYAKGSGQISQDDATANNGALLRRTIRHLVAPAAANPITTPVGYTLVDQSYQDAEGHRIWTAVYAKGAGELSRSIDYNNSGDQGTTGLTRTTIRHLVAPSGTVQPTVLSGSIEVARSFEDADGYRIWTTVWAKGTGQISTETRYVQSLNQGTTGATVITIRHLTAISVTTNPITTPAGTVLISQEQSDQDGYRVWTAVYAKGGSGVVASSNDVQNAGKLVIYRRSSIGAAPTTPISTIGGTVTSIAESSRTDSGYTVYDYSWAEGVGIVAERIQYRDGGLRLLNREIFVNQGATTYVAYTPANGIEVDKSFTEGDGIRRYSVTWIQSSSGGDPLTNPALQFVSKVPFTYPGRAKSYFSSFTSGSYTTHRAFDVFMSPPFESLIDATTIVYYKSTNTAPTPSAGYTLWNPTQWATMRAKWIGWSNSPRSKVEGLRGYIAENSGSSGTSISGYDTSVLGDRVYAGTDWSITLSGGPSNPGGTNLTLSLQQVPAFTRTDGTQYYRVTEVYATIPVQAALPV